MRSEGRHIFVPGRCADAVEVMKSKDRIGHDECAENALMTTKREANSKVVKLAVRSA